MTRSTATALARLTNRRLADQPASMVTVVPVMPDAAGEARNAIVAATSRAVTGRPRADARRQRSTPSGHACARPSRPTSPGATATTRMPRAPSSAGRGGGEVVQRRLGDGIRACGWGWAAAPRSTRRPRRRRPSRGGRRRGAAGRWWGAGPARWKASQAAVSRSSHATWPWGKAFSTTTSGAPTASVQRSSRSSHAASRAVASATVEVGVQGDGTASGGLDVGDRGGGAVRVAAVVHAHVVARARRARARRPGPGRRWRR